VRLQGIVPVHVDAIPTIGPPSRAGSIPIERKWDRAPARAASSRSPARAARRRASRSSPPAGTPESLCQP
jgi:hypothetical protein